MGKIIKSIEELIGNTPIMQFRKFQEKYELSANILAKLERFNLTGSVKDRVALEIIDQAEKDGLLNSDSVIIEPTSGNTGIGLAAVATAGGYRTIIVMPDNMSVERRNLIKAYGAEIVLTPGKLGMTGAIEKAEQLKNEIPSSIIAGQFTNSANPKAHYETTGPEIYNDTDGKIDVFVCGVGTGGTITGVGRYLKEKNPNVKIVAVEPEKSAVLSGGEKGAHQIQGIGAGFVPEVLDENVYDEVIVVEDEATIKMAKDIADLESVFVGISSGAAMVAAIEVAKRSEYAGKNIVVLLPDSGERYLSI